MDTPAQNPRKLYKSRRNRMIDGVCGGIAEYFDIDPTIVRILWVLMTLLGGSGFFLYIAAMIVMPTNPELRPAEEGDPPGAVPDRRRFWGIILVLFGSFILMINLGWLADLGWWSFSRSVVFPVLLILLGMVLVVEYAKKRGPVSSAGESAPEGGAPPPPPVRELHKSAADRKLFGVCGGIAKYFGVDSTIVRVLFILLVLASVGWGLPLYIILAIIMPQEKLSVTSA